jgi:flagellar hook protein FlgE
MGSFSIALTGLNADTTALNTIGNNLANLNTTAFKDQTTEFSDLFYQQVGSSGSGDAIQQGLGTRVSSTNTDFTQGTLATGSSSTDMAIQGNGFFVVNNGGTQELTRAGDFQLDSSGNLTTADGYNVMGTAASNGVITSGGALVPLQLPVGSTQAAQQTTQVGITGNLDASAPVGTQFSTAVTIYDSLGTSHVATATFTNTGPNQWGYAITLPAGDETGTPVGNTGTLSFNSSGNLISPSSNVTGISFPGMADGSADMSMKWSLFDAAGNSTISQTAGTSASTATTQNGYASGTYNGFTVDDTGVISAQYSNGETQVVGQVALANVENAEGLTRAGDNAYVATQASGAATVGIANAGGLGIINDDSLEGSNVNISTEFTNLIVAQRAFEANSKTVTTFDTLTQETINLIR